MCALNHLWVIVPKISALVRTPQARIKWNTRRYLAQNIQLARHSNETKRIMPDFGSMTGVRCPIHGLLKSAPSCPVHTLYTACRRVIP